MKQQRNSGIKVMFTLESQLKNSTYYQQHNRGMVEFQYSGRGEILMLETVRYWEAIQRGEPPTLRVVWKPSELKDEDDYLNWLLNSPQSSGVKDFDPKAPAPF